MRQWFCFLFLLQSFFLLPEASAGMLAVMRCMDELPIEIDYKVVKERWGHRDFLPWVRKLPQEQVEKESPFGREWEKVEYDYHTVVPNLVIGQTYRILVDRQSGRFYEGVYLGQRSSEYSPFSLDLMTFELKVSKEMEEVVTRSAEMLLPENPPYRIPGAPLGVSDFAQWEIFAFQN